MLFKRQSKNRAFFQKYFDLRPPWANPRADPLAKQRSENPTPGTTKMCESPGVVWGRWSGLELTDTLIGYFKMRMKLEKKTNNNVIVISVLWPHHHFDVWPQLRSRRFWGFWLNISKWRNWFSQNVCHFLDNYPQSVLKVKDRSIFDGREEKWYFLTTLSALLSFGQRFEIKSPKLPHIPNFILIHRKTAKTWSHFSWCRDTSTLTIMTSYHQIQDDVITFLAIWKDL